MNAALRPLAAIVVIGVAACTPDADDHTGQASTATPANAPPASRAEATKPGYMTDHVAKDAALTDALIGTWIEADAVDPSSGLQAVIRYAADHSLAVSVGHKDKPGATLAGTGTWSIAQGFLTYQMTIAGSNESGSDEILRLDNGQLVYIDGNDKKTKIATRMSDAALTAAAAAPQPAAPAPAPAVAAAPPRDTPFVDDTIFVAGDDVGAHTFRVIATTQIRLSVDIEEKVPVNVIVQRGQFGATEYLTNLGLLMVGQVMAMFDDGKGEKASNTDDLFNNRLSKRAAYGSFASPWVTLNPGTYTVILDNSGQLSPSRGDAPVHLRLYSRPVP